MTDEKVRDGMPERIYVGRCADGGFSYPYSDDGTGPPKIGTRNHVPYVRADLLAAVEQERDAERERAKRWRAVAYDLEGARTHACNGWCGASPEGCPKRAAPRAFRNARYEFDGIVSPYSDEREFAAKPADRPESAAPKPALCECGHGAKAHIYETGPCRPGFLCPDDCKEYRAAESAT